MAFSPTSALADEGTLIANGTLDADEGTLVANGTLDPEALPGLAGPLIVKFCLPPSTSVGPCKQQSNYRQRMQLVLEQSQKSSLTKTVNDEITAQGVQEFGNKLELGLRRIHIDQ
jgi:hypothetical protein